MKKQASKGFIVVLALLMIVGLAIGFMIGYSLGVKDGIGWSVRLGLNFVNLSIDETALTNGVWNYQHYINNCFNSSEITWKN